MGDLAYEDRVQVAMLGDTVILGGYLRTELIRAKSIKADQLDVDDLAAISGRFSGDVWVGGDLLVGGQGVLSIFQFISTDTPRVGGPAQGWSAFGLEDSGGTLGVGACSIVIPVPSNIVLIKATLTVEAMPIFYEDLSFPANTRWKQSRNLKLYLASASEGYYHLPVPSASAGIVWRDQSDITSEVLGLSAWSPTLAYSGNDPANTQNKVQYQSGNILPYLTPGQNTTFSIQTTDTPTAGNFANNQGLGRMVVVLEGYAVPG